MVFRPNWWHVWRWSAVRSGFISSFQPSLFIEAVFRRRTSHDLHRPDRVFAPTPLLPSKQRRHKVVSWQQSWHRERGTNTFPSLARTEDWEKDASLERGKLRGVLPFSWPAVPAAALPWPHTPVPVLPVWPWRTRLCSAPSGSPSWPSRWSPREAGLWPPADIRTQFSCRQRKPLGS